MMMRKIADAMHRRWGTPCPAPVARELPGREGAPGGGEWSVFAEKVVAERDALQNALDDIADLFGGGREVASLDLPDFVNRFVAGVYGERDALRTELAKRDTGGAVDMEHKLLTLTAAVETFRADPHRRNMAALFAALDEVAGG